MLKFCAFILCFNLLYVTETIAGRIRFTSFEDAISRFQSHAKSGDVHAELYEVAGKYVLHNCDSPCECLSKGMNEYLYAAEYCDAILERAYSQYNCDQREWKHFAGKRLVDEGGFLTELKKQGDNIVLKYKVLYKLKKERGCMD